MLLWFGCWPAVRLGWCYCSVAVLESLSLLGSGNDSGVKLYNSFVLSLEGKAGLWSPWEILIGGIIC